jgi:hypothetical protein
MRRGQRRVVDRDEEALAGASKTTLTTVMLDTIVCASEDALVSILISFTIVFESWPATRPTKPVNATSAAEAMEKNFIVVEGGGVGVMRRLAVGRR